MFEAGAVIGSVMRHYVLAQNAIQIGLLYAMQSVSPGMIRHLGPRVGPARKFFVASM